MAPGTNSSHDHDSAAPSWLGSAARRGLAYTHGAGWLESDDGEEARPQWLGSVARREGLHAGGAGWAEADQEEQPKWLGSVARRGDNGGTTERAESGDDSARSLVLIDIETVPVEQTREDTPQTRPEPEDRTVPTEAGARPEPDDELDDRRQTRVVVGDIGMHLRVA